MGIRVISDVHGHIDEYINICKEAEKLGLSTVQLGDLGFYYSKMKKLDPAKNFMFGGNHDNYDELPNLPHNLGDFGPKSINGVDFFFVRGAWSIDKAYRTPGLDYWPQEELSFKQCQEALELYKQTKPEIVLSHDCPNEIRDVMLVKGLGMGYKRYQTKTGDLLQAMLDFWQPELFIFGHWHISFTHYLPKIRTKFICLPELGYIDI